jgi:tetratricopeptide (TPR) repeat protein
MRNRIFTAALMMVTLVAVTGLATAQDLEARVQSGWAALQAGDLATARTDFQAVIDGSPVYDFGWYALGQVATQEGKPDEAVTNFQKAIEINPNKFEYHYGLAAAYRTKQEYAKAIATLNNAETQATTPQTKYYLHLERGVSYMSIRNWDSAAGDLQEAVKLQPEENLANQRYGMALYRLEDYPQASTYLRKAVAVNPKDGTSQLYLARAAINLAQREADEAKKKAYYAEAVKAGTVANAASPGFDAQNILAKAYLGAGQYDQATRGFQKVIQTKPDYCIAHTNLGQSYVGMEAWPQATQALEKAADCDPKSTLTLNLLAFAYVKENRKDMALTTYEKSYGLKPDPNVAQNIEKVTANLDIDMENAAIDASNDATLAQNEADRLAHEKERAEFEAEQERIRQYKEDND